MAQSKQSTPEMVLKVGFLPGTEVTMQSSRPEEVFLTSLTCYQIKFVIWGYGHGKRANKEETKILNNKKNKKISTESHMSPTH